MYQLVYRLNRTRKIHTQNKPHNGRQVRLRHLWPDPRGDQVCHGKDARTASAKHGHKRQGVPFVCHVSHHLQLERIVGMKGDLGRVRSHLGDWLGIWKIGSDLGEYRVHGGAIELVRLVKGKGMRFLLRRRGAFFLLLRHSDREIARPGARAPPSPGRSRSQPRTSLVTCRSGRLQPHADIVNFMNFITTVV